MKKMTTAVLLAAAAASCLPSARSSGALPLPEMIVNAQADGFGSASYAYGPTIIRTHGVYHAYFCSTPSGQGGQADLDDIRHIHSTDLVHWSAPEDLMRPTANERSNCDPSVVLFNAGDGPYYYMFYTGNVRNVQSAMFVARSISPDGPFLKLTDRGTWESQPPDPHVIVRPFQNTADPDPAGIYGAGQPSVVVRNHTLIMWYMDDTQTLPGNHVQRIYERYSSDGKSWSSPATTNVAYTNSIDVKYDPATKRFVMFGIDNQFGASSLVVRTSPDGVFTWSDEHVLCDATCFPPGASNPGVSGDEQGTLLDGSPIMVAYAAPYVLGQPAVWANWDLYGSLVTHSQIYARTPNLFMVAGGETATHSTEVHVLTAASFYSKFSLHTRTPLGVNDGSLDYELADWTHSGAPDLGLVKKFNTSSGMTEVHILSASGNYQHYVGHTITAQPPTDDTFQFRFVDYDGDGIPDLAVIHTSDTASGHTEIRILSGVSGYRSDLLIDPVTDSPFVATAFRTFTANASFYMLDWDQDGAPDLALVLGGTTGSGNKEVHIVSAASGFQQFLVHAATTLAEDDGPFQYQFTDWDGDGVPDLVAIKQARTGSGTTEVHVLSGASGFTQFLLHQPTALPQTDDTSALLMPAW